MALTNVLLLSQIAGHVIGLIVALCMIVPMIMHYHEFNGKCLLFSHGTWNSSNGLLEVKWAPSDNCDYIIFVGVLTFIVCCVQMYRLSMLMYRGEDSSFLSAFLEAVGSAVLCGLVVCAAVIVTLGFMTWCNNILERFPNCEDAAGLNIDPSDGIQTSGFYIEIGTAQFGAWAAFATWVGLAVFSTLKVCRYHQLENIQVSMYRERQRLVNESGNTSSQDQAEQYLSINNSAREGWSTPPIDVAANANRTE